MTWRRWGWALAWVCWLAWDVGIGPASEPTNAVVPAAVGQRAVRELTQQAAATSGVVDTAGSRVFIRVDKTGLGHVHGVVGRIKQGVIRLGATHNAGQLVFDMKTFVVDTLEARRYVGLEGTTSASTQRQVTANMLGPDVLDVGHFPTATYVLDTARLLEQPSQSGNPRYQLNGRFTLHGVTRPLRMIAQLTQRGNQRHLRGGFTLLQTDYGMTPYTKAFGALGVANRLTIWGDILFVVGTARTTQVGRHGPH